MTNSGYELQNRSQEPWDKNTIPIKIAAIYDLGPNYTDRYTIVRSPPPASRDGMQPYIKALVIGENAEYDNPPPHWIIIGNAISTSQFGMKIEYRNLPENVKNYLETRKIFPDTSAIPPGSQPRDPKSIRVFSHRDIKEIANETLEHLCKEYPLERNTIMRASFEIFCAEIISRAYNESYKRTNH